MIFSTYVPQPPLQPFIHHFSYFKNQQIFHAIDRFLPDGNVEIVIDLTEEPKLIYDNITLAAIQECKQAWISGIRRKCISIPSGKDSELFVIHFNKGMMHPFLQLPLSEITDTVVPADILLASLIKNLRECLLYLATAAQKFIFAEQYLLKHFGKSLSANPFITYAISKIVSKPQTITIEEVTAKVGYSQKHLIHLFKQHVGVSPKVFLRIIRFQKAIQEIEQRKTVNWTQLAHESGYYDQAHFIADFKDFSGFTPLEYLKRKNGTLNYVPVA